MMKRNARWLCLMLILVALLSALTLSVLAEEEPTPAPEPVLTLEGYDGTLLTMEKGETARLLLKVKSGMEFTYEKTGITHSSMLSVDYAVGIVDVRALLGYQGEEPIVVTLYGKAKPIDSDDPDDPGEDVSVSFNVKVHSPVTSASISQDDQVLNKGDKFTFKATYGPGDATDTTTVWKSSDPSVATIDEASGEVHAIAPGTTKISVTVGGVAAPVDKVVHVSGLTMKQPTEPLLVGKAMSIEYRAYGAAADQLEEWTSSNPAVADVASGNVYAYTPGKTTITLKMGHYVESCTVTVEEDVASAILRDLSAGENLLFSDILEELNKRAEEKLSGVELDYISAISADPAAGVVYYGYSSPESPGMGVGNIDSFYRNPNSSQMGIEDLTFVPNRGFGGTTVINYVGYGEGVPFSGRIRVTVEASSDVSYSTTAGQVLFFSAEDFNAACKVKTGQALRYVTFRLPAKAQGTLYQSYNTAGQYMPQVSTETKYYVYGSTLLIDKIAFLPAEGFTGTVSIPYTATDSSGTSYSGTVTVEVNPASGGSTWVDDAVSYTTSGEAVTFAGTDFNAACKQANGEELDYICITPPAEAEGKLWLNYTSSSKPGTAVTASTRLSVKDLDKVTFVPRSGYAGTVTLQFTGFDKKGGEFKGTVTIRVLHYDVLVEYTTGSLAVTFDPEDFRFATLSALPKKLSGVEFHELPASYEGKLLYDRKDAGSGSAVERGTRYYYSGTPALGKITFVPKADYQGTVELSYTAYDTAGNTVDGMVVIHVSRSYATTNFSDLTGYSSAIPAIEYLRSTGVIGGYSDGTFRPTAATSRGAYAAMVCRLFGFKAEVGSAPFPDVAKDSWCADVAAAAKKYGVVTGDKKGMFNPNASVTKQQAVVMLQRAMEAADWEVETTSTSVLLNYRDNASVSSYARAAMANMIGMGVVEADVYGYLKPDQPITRVEMATILYRLLTR